jgi:Ca-activated chloride channel family protein
MPRRIHIAWMMMMMIWLCILLASGAPAQSPGDSPAIKVDVKLVTVYATVTTPSGAPVSSLEKNNFQVLEDDVAQNIAVFRRESELPLSIILAIDTSLSTRSDLPLELESARRFVHAILRPVDALALYQFDAQVNEIVPFTSNLHRIDAGIDRLRVGTATALYDAVYLGSQALEARQGRKVMVVITDGGDTFSSVRYAEALRAAQQSEALIYSVIMVPIAASAGRNTGGEHALIQLSNDTGGKYYYADTSRGGLDQAFQKISTELRTQYLLAYYPSQRLSDSDFRRIEVRVTPAAATGGGNSPEQLVVRHRTGYYTTKIR